MAPTAEPASEQTERRRRDVIEQRQTQARQFAKHRRDAIKFNFDARAIRTIDTPLSGKRFAAAD